jgi:hypothetical protein
MKSANRTSKKAEVMLGYICYTLRALSLILGQFVCIREAILGFLDDWGPPIRAKKKPHPYRDEESIDESNNYKGTVKKHGIHLPITSELWEELLS